MHKPTPVISAQDQIKIATQLLELSELATGSKGAQELQLLTNVVETLAPYADETHITIMFDLGEYLFESSQVLAGMGKGSEQNRDYVKASLLASIKAWEESRNNPSR